MAYFTIKGSMAFKVDGVEGFPQPEDYVKAFLKFKELYPKFQIEYIDDREFYELCAASGKPIFSGDSHWMGESGYSYLNSVIPEPAPIETLEVANEMDQFMETIENCIDFDMKLLGSLFPMGITKKSIKSNNNG